MGNGEWKISKLLIKVICEGQGRGGREGGENKKNLGEK
jgi:hypothetical protein